MLTSAQIWEACRLHRHEKILLGPKVFLGQDNTGIPRKKDLNARASMNIPANETLIALIDTTVFGSAKDGFVIGERGLYWKASFLTPDQMTWEELREVSFHATKAWTDTAIHFSDGRNASLAGANETIDTVYELLLELQRLTRENSHSSLPTVQWMAAFGQQQFGPFDPETLRKEVAEGRLDATQLLVWRDGLADWVAYLSVPELANAVTPAPKIAITPIPPLPIKEPINSERSGSPVTIESDQPLTDLNNAGLDELLCLPGFTLSFAERVIKERQQRFGFQTVEDVGEFLLLSPHVVQRLKETATVNVFRSSKYSSPSGGRVVDF